MENLNGRLYCFSSLFRLQSATVNNCLDLMTTVRYLCQNVRHRIMYAELFYYVTTEIPEELVVAGHRSSHLPFEAFHGMSYPSCTPLSIMGCTALLQS